MEALLLLVFAGVLMAGWYMLRGQRAPWLLLAAAVTLLVLAWVLAGPGPIGPRIVVSAVALAAVIEAVGQLRGRSRHPPA